MDLYAQILAHYLSNKNAQITFSNLSINAEQIVAQQAYIALSRIVHIVRNNSFDDETCFEQIEQIVCELEKIGISAGTRHDFG